MSPPTLDPPSASYPVVRGMTGLTPVERAHPDGPDHPALSFLSAGLGARLRRTATGYAPWRVSAAVSTHWSEDVLVPNDCTTRLSSTPPTAAFATPASSHAWFASAIVKVVTAV